MSTSSGSGRLIDPRRLTAADLEALIALEAAHGWPAGGSPRQLERALASPDAALFGVAAAGDPAAAEALPLPLSGYALAARLPFEAELQAILVHERHRGGGVAQRLLAAVVEQAHGWGSERLLLEVRAGNAAAIGLYHRAGFQTDGVRRGYYPPRRAGTAREDALLMSLALDRE